MRKPDIPDNEQQRISTLRSLNVLDTMPEERFDRLTRMALRLFDVPISVISLVDSERQWFKSIQGLNVTETERDVSFCGHAILNDDIFIVNDATKDERFFDNPIVTSQPNIQFYAGYPLKHPDGSRLGTLCVIDTQPRNFREEDSTLLFDLGQVAEQELLTFQLATLDELTMLSNRRGFEAMASHALNWCDRTNQTSALMFFDLDYFKQINDVYGHNEGDRALHTFSNALLSTFRSSDIIARLGGDEFVVLFMNSDLTQAQQAIMRLEGMLSAFNTIKSRGYKIEFSVGVAEYKPNSGTSEMELLLLADRAMYRCKAEHHRGDHH